MTAIFKLMTSCLHSSASFKASKITTEGTWISFFLDWCFKRRKKKTLLLQETQPCNPLTVRGRYSRLIEILPQPDPRRKKKKRTKIGFIARVKLIKEKGQRFIISHNFLEAKKLVTSGSTTFSCFRKPSVRIARGIPYRDEKF